MLPTHRRVLVLILCLWLLGWMPIAATAVLGLLELEQLRIVGHLWAWTPATLAVLFATFSKGNR